MYGITFCNDDTIFPAISQDDVSEHISIEESLTAQQQTLLQNEDQYLRIAPGEHYIPQCLLFDEHAEEPFLHRHIQVNFETSKKT